MHRALKCITRWSLKTMISRLNVNGNLPFDPPSICKLEVNMIEAATKALENHTCTDECAYIPGRLQ